MNQKAILDALRKQPMTIGQLHQVLGMNRDSIASVLCVLRKKGKIINSGISRNKGSRNGHIWAIRTSRPKTWRDRVCKVDDGYKVGRRHFTQRFAADGYAYRLQMAA